MHDIRSVQTTNEVFVRNLNEQKNQPFVSFEDEPEFVEPLPFPVLDAKKVKGWKVYEKVGRHIATFKDFGIVYNNRGFSLSEDGKEVVIWAKNAK